MEKADGGTLEEFLKTIPSNTKLQQTDIVNIFKQLSLGMKAINSKFIHRDIKPDNILLSDGKWKISDFGLSKFVGAATRNYSFKGINHIKYCPPEGWFFGPNEMTMDIYSMGIVFYEIATLNYPYQINILNDPIDEYRKAHLYQPPILPTTFNSSLPNNLTQLLIRMLSKQPKDRYQNWDEILNRINTVSDKAIEIDISSLVNKAVEKHVAEEERKNKAINLQKVEEEESDIVSYGFEKVNNEIIKLVEIFNKQSDFIKLDFIRNNRFASGVFINNNHSRGVELSLIPIKQIRPTCREGKIIAWGIAQSISGIGFNLLLIKKDDSDYYGGLYSMFNQQVFPGRSDEVRPSQFPFSLQELPSEIDSIYSMHIYQSKIVEYEISQIEELIKELIDQNG
jgi:eukaryotic-like serine/threonine-protein kinase